MWGEAARGASFDKRKRLLRIYNVGCLASLFGLVGFAGSHGAFPSRLFVLFCFSVFSFSLSLSSTGALKTAFRRRSSYTSSLAKPSQTGLSWMESGSERVESGWAPPPSLSVVVVGVRGPRNGRPSRRAVLWNAAGRAVVCRWKQCVHLWECLSSHGLSVLLFLFRSSSSSHQKQRR